MKLSLQVSFEIVYEIVRVIAFVIIHLNFLIIFAQILPKNCL